MYLYVVNFWRLQFFAVLFILFLTFFIISVQTDETVEYSSIPSITPTSETIKPNFCGNKNTTTSCSHQISVYGGNQDSCSLVKYDNKSEDCASRSFKGDSDPDGEYGKVILSAYILHKNYAYIAFNVTFTDIKWTRARMRFYESGSKVPDICREFQLTSQIPIETRVFYDCLWNYNIESKAYHFQYIAYPRSGHSAVTHQFVFYVPSVLLIGTNCDGCPEYRRAPVDVKKLQVFVSVDVSVLPELRLHVQLAHEMYNITSYKILLVRTWVDHKWPVMNRVETVLPNQTHLYLVHNTDYRPGIYNFSVIPLHDSCDKGICSPSRAPGILIVASTETPLLIAMVGTVILIPVLIGIYFMWRRTCVPRPTGNEPWQPPKVLLVYNPDYKSHVSDMIRFTEYLKRKCRVEPMFDLFCIPNSASKDPVTWYSENFTTADYILVFTSPPGPKSVEPHECNPYLNLDKIATNQLKLLYIRNWRFLKRLNSILIGNKQIFAVKLPKCTWETLCPEARFFQRFNLPVDFDKLLKHMGVPPIGDKGKSLTAALSADVERILQLLPRPSMDLEIPIDMPKKQPVERSENSKLFEMNLMGSKTSENEEQERHRSNSFDTLLNINDLKLI